MSPQDIPRAEECGVDAIWISNHGGRQLDTAPATILALPSIRAKINCKYFMTQRSVQRWSYTSMVESDKALTSSSALPWVLTSFL